MKTLSRLALLALIVVPTALFVCGCDSETKADPAIIDQMNKQRAAQMPGKTRPGSTPSVPGTPPGK